LDLNSPTFVSHLAVITGGNHQAHLAFLRQGLHNFYPDWHQTAILPSLPPTYLGL
jgi:hypothetical protein